MWVGLVSGLFGSAMAEEPRIEPAAAEAAGEPGNLNLPGFEGKMPTAQQLLEVLDSMAGIPEDEKEKLKEDLLRNVKERAAAAAEQAGFAGSSSSDLTTQTIVLLSLLAIVALIFVFFLYKLFKCLSEREQKKKEGKKRNKQLKKKK